MSEVDLPEPIETTVEADEELVTREVAVCPGCGRPEPLWRGDEGQGYHAEDGHRYCCHGCFDETGCTCR